MRKKVTTAIAVTVLVMSSAFAAGALGKSNQQADGPSLHQDFIALQKAFISAQERGDAEYVKNAVADDFIGIEKNGDTTGRAEFIRLEKSEKPGQPPILYDFRVIQLDQDCTVVTYNVVFPADQTDRYQHISDTWVNRDTHWKLKFQQSTLNIWSAHD